MSHGGSLFLQGPSLWLDISAGTLGLLGMSVFFTLSGFVIQYNYDSSIVGSPRKAMPDFLMARIVRIYPLFVALLLVELLTGPRSGRGFSEPRRRQGVSTHLVPFQHGMVQSWFFRKCRRCCARLAIRRGRHRLLVSEHRMVRLSRFSARLSSPCADQNCARRGCLRHWSRCNRAWHRAYGAHAAGPHQPVCASRLWHGRGSAEPEARLSSGSSAFSPFCRVWEFVLGCCLARLHEVWSAQKFRPSRSLLNIMTIVGVGAIGWVFWFTGLHLGRP
ncbi:hypothetical protein ACVW17_003245 [Bradyrhizobium sp. USDA 4473]